MFLAKVSKNHAKMTMNAMRAFGGGGHGHHHEQKHSHKQNTSINIPDHHDVQHNIQEKNIVNDNFLFWVYGRAPVDRLSDKLINDKPNKYSAYFQFGSNPLLQNGLVLKAIRMLFGDSSSPNLVNDQHASFNGVQTHENGVFLYQSKQANWALRYGYGDIVSAGLIAGYLFVPALNHFLLPALVSTMFIPRRIVQ